MAKQQLTAAALPKARSTRLVVRELDSETLIYDLESHKATCLNDFSAQVWRLCDGNRTVSDITEALDLADPSEGAVALTLRKLTKADLLTGVIHSEHAVPSALSRRAVVHRALAITAAIPVVTSMTIPTPAQAASCIPLGGGPCTEDDQCCTNKCNQSTHICIPD